MRALDEEQNPWAAGALKLLLYTGCRLTEILSLKWECVDLDQATILLPQTKKGEPRAVDLSPAAIRLLEALPREVDNPYCFPGGKKGDRLRDIKRPWARVLAKAKVENLHVHDLRRSLGTWLINSGTRLEVVSKILGHRRLETTRKHYSHLLVDATRSALDGFGPTRETLAIVPKGGSVGSEGA